MMNIATTTLNCLDTAISISEITRAAAGPVLKLMLATTNVLSAYIRVAASASTDTPAQPPASRTSGAVA